MQDTQNAESEKTCNVRFSKSCHDHIYKNAVRPELVESQCQLLSDPTSSLRMIVAILLERFIPETSF